MADSLVVHGRARTAVSTVDQAYQELGLLRGASAQLIRRKYLQLSIRHHPDKQQGPGASSDPHAFNRINDAYNTLLNNPIAQIDRANAERDAEFNAALDAELEAEFAKLDARKMQREKTEQLEFERRQERRQADNMSKGEARDKHAWDFPPAVLFNDRSLITRNA